ncbi:hypothetical protein [uncultured Streptomyces sp.]|uniref:hypothetical protein n=1 Tax=uncultured Streptomyces sp. TaxID=174707 RepID=UPI0026156080|nr:hypothetical protein [uncultured Streptomyces sp.]
MKQQVRCESVTRRLGGTARGAAGTPARRFRAAAVAALAVALVTGCSVAGSGGGGSAEYGLRPGAAPSPSVTGASGLAAKALDADSVAGAAVTTPRGADALSPKDVRAEKGCAPLARALAGTTVGEPAASTSRRVSSGGQVTAVTLASYENEDAVAAMTELSAASDACTGGFAFTVRDEQVRVVREGKALSPAGADQSMAFTLTLAAGSSTTGREVIALRSGTTICLLSALDPTGSAAAGPADIPTAVVEAQLAALA